MQYFNMTAIESVTDDGSADTLLAHHLARLTLILLALTFYLRGVRRRRQLPPGPRPWPLIGNLNLLAKNPTQPYKVITELSRTYGPVMRFTFGGQEAVIISDYELMEEAFVKHADITSERPDIIMKWEEERSGKEARQIQESFWPKIHKFNESILHKVGVCRAPFEQRFGADLDSLLQALGQQSGEFDPSTILTQCVTSISWHFSAGKRLEYDDPLLDELVKLVFTNLNDMKSSIIQTYFYVPEWLQSLHMRLIMNPVSFRMYGVIRSAIAEHVLDQSGGRINDVIGAMIEMQRKQPENTLYSEHGMLRTMHSFLLGGVDSMQSVLRWLFIYFIHYPEVQERCYNDVMEHIGDSRVPSSNDFPNLKYVTATVYEVLRHGNIAPLGVPHSSHSDVEIGGHVIPKETLIFSNQYAVHRDPRLWERADEFRPERWLNPVDGTIRKREGFIPFSIGPRHCPGEKLAKLQLVLLTAGILQRYAILPSVEAPVPDLEGVQVLSAAPKPFHIRVGVR